MSLFPSYDVSSFDETITCIHVVDKLDEREGSSFHMYCMHRRVYLRVVVVGPDSLSTSLAWSDEFTVQEIIANSVTTGAGKPHLNRRGTVLTVLYGLYMTWLAAIRLEKFMSCLCIHGVELTSVSAHSSRRLLLLVLCRYQAV